jgi:hypothetical protein
MTSSSKLRKTSPTLWSFTITENSFITSDESYISVFDTVTRPMLEKAATMQHSKMAVQFCL